MQKASTDHACRKSGVGPRALTPVMQLMSLIGAALLAIGVGTASAQGGSVGHSLSPTDSIAVLKQARRAQSDFERRRFSMLPIVGSAGSRW